MAEETLNTNTTTEQQKASWSRHLFDARLRRVLMINDFSYTAGKAQNAQDSDDRGTDMAFYQEPFGVNGDDKTGFYNEDDTTNGYLSKPYQLPSTLSESDRKEQERAVASAKSNTRLHKATASLMNPYAMTRLYGAVGGKYLVDRYDRRKYYEIDGNDDGHYASNPTTANIIKWGCADAWGRTPYSFQDFVFCKYWNKISNNRMITLRRYTSPTYDNLNFEGMEQKKVTAHPVATAVTYFGEGTDNKLSDLLKFSAGIPWQDETGNIWTSTAEVPTMQLAEKGIGWDKIYTSGISNMATALGMIGDYNKNNFFDKDAAKGLPDDPYRSGQYANRILGPINQINKVKRRAKEGENNQAKELEFSMDSLNLTFEYVARPISGINQKAALLDLMANMLVMCYASAVFFGGMHRFMINPQAYPFADEPSRQALHQGKVIGQDGAAALMIKNFKTAASNGANGDGSPTNILSMLGGTLSGLLGKALDGTALGEFLSGRPSANTNQSKNAQENVEDMIASSIQSKMNTISFLSNMRAILKGEPVGDWHLVIGNPMNPIVQIGNLVCSKIDFKFSDELGPDDFPIGFKATVKLEHGMARDRDGIEAMFNRGAGRIYVLPDKYSSSADGQTDIDSFTKIKGSGAYTWETGYQVPAGSRHGTTGTTDDTGVYNDAYKTVGFQQPNISNEMSVNDLFYKQDMSTVIHHIMPWQTKIVL